VVGIRRICVTLATLEESIMLERLLREATKPRGWRERAVVFEGGEGQEGGALKDPYNTFATPLQHLYYYGGDWEASGWRAGVGAGH
jgi:hypothetical protein